MGDRITGSRVDLDYKDVQRFFDTRGENKQLGSKYNYVLYQDDCPELAVKRDLQEKEKISQMLSLECGQRVLDIGCGIGRWGEYLLECQCVKMNRMGHHNDLHLRKRVYCFVAHPKN